MYIFPLDCLENSLIKMNKIIEDNKTELNSLLSEPEKTYNGFVRPFMEVGERLNVFFTPVAHLQSVKNSESSQQAFTECIGEITAYYTELSHNKDVYDSFVEIKNKEYERLDTASQKVLDDAILNFELEGVNLAEDKKSRIKKINIRLSELGNDFSQNLLNATNAYKIEITDEKVLGEMPASDKASAKTDKGWTFTLQMPSYIAFMTHVTDRSLRETVYKAYSTRAPENAALITEILSLRAEKANILGAESYAELNLRSMAAPSVDTVLTFLEKLGKTGKPHGMKDVNDMLEIAKADGMDEIAAYDTAYYSEKLKKERYDFDEEKLRPYFEKESVVNCLFEILRKIFGVTASKKDAELWDEKAVYYELSLHGRKAGLYLDLEARPDKRGGAWMNNWHTHHKDANNVEHMADAFVVANFPVSTLDTPSLLRHDDVTTLFHEMGHAIHHLFSGVDEISVSGVNGIDWDTVEFPSQFLENFAYAPQVLDMLSKHHLTGETIPKDLRDKLINARNFQAGFALVRQTEFGLFDMRIHLAKMDDKEVQRCLDGVRKEVSVIIPPKYNKFQHGFSHIFSGGYAAGYYSYKWAEMLSADAYCAFMEAGIFNETLAKSYLDTVLKLGASRKMDEIYRMFLGRDPDPEALLKLAGLE